jgi:hypothetical protein
MYLCSFSFLSQRHSVQQSAAPRLSVTRKWAGLDVVWEQKKFEVTEIA